MQNKVYVIDYGVGNLLSVVRAIEKCGFKPILASKQEMLSKAKKIILPGVGAFPNAVKELKLRGLFEPLKNIAAKRTYLLGICLGMQLFMDESEEFGFTEGLGIIPGKVVRIPQKNHCGNSIKLPSIGWYKLQTKEKTDYKQLLVEKINKKNSFYFVHSYMTQPKNTSMIRAYYSYEKIKIPAILQYETVFGCQFHPEKSGQDGLKFLKTFLSLK